MEFWPDTLTQNEAVMINRVSRVSLLIGLIILHQFPLQISILNLTGCGSPVRKRLSHQPIVNCPASMILKY